MPLDNVTGPDIINRIINRPINDTLEIGCNIEYVRHTFLTAHTSYVSLEKSEAARRIVLKRFGCWGDNGNNSNR